MSAFSLLPRATRSWREGCVCVCVCGGGGGSKIILYTRPGTLHYSGISEHMQCSSLPDRQHGCTLEWREMKKSIAYEGGATTSSQSLKCCKACLLSASTFLLVSFPNTLHASVAPLTSFLHIRYCSRALVPCIMACDL